MGKKLTIRKIVNCLNNEEENGGYWLPNIQRPFVWKEEQIERLFDSIMRSYPISTMLAWRTKDEIKGRKFIDGWHSKLRLTDFYINVNSKAKYFVLDGQQRLQSFFIALKGSYNKKELCLDLLSGENKLPDDIQYKFKFIEKDDIKLPWVNIKNIVFSQDSNKTIRKMIISKFENSLSDDEESRIEDNIDLLLKRFNQDDTIVFQELDSVEYPELYTQDDVVEIFIRCNSGGTILSKSDLLFSLLTVSWEDSEEKMEELLESLNNTDYKFDRDFILKCCLSILKKGAQYNVKKFRNQEIKEEIMNNWNRLSEAIEDVKDFLFGKTYIKSNKALSSYLTLIPLIYFRYHYKEKWNKTKDIDIYILRTLLSGVFGGSPDNLIDKCTNRIDEVGDFYVNDIFDTIKSSGRNLEINSNNIIKEHYESKNIYLLFNLWYMDFNYVPSFQNNTPQIDHIFPQSALRNMKEHNPKTGREVMKYKKDARNQIANLMLLKQNENGPGGKSDILPEKWFMDKDESYLERHLIPKDKELWKLENYDEFIEERKKLILDKFKFLII